MSANYRSACRIKIRQQFASDQPGDPASAAHLRATIGQAGEFWIEIIVEGVETAAAEREAGPSDGAEPAGASA
jgi:EAL domain-containing protein (putative c-di-GMP-specific phosphodiesterase class I)